MTDQPSAAKPETPFHDLDHYLAIPRLSGLTLSPDGKRLVTTVATLDPKKTGYRNALWQIDPRGTEPARRLTRSAKGESAAAFTADGRLLFTSARPDPEAADDDSRAALWELPATGGEARVLHSREGGVGGFTVNTSSNAIVVRASVLPGAVDEETDAELRKARKEKKISAILHSGYPVRFWDRDLGPDQDRLFVLEEVQEVPELPGTSDSGSTSKLRLITEGIGAGLLESETVLSPDGSFALVGVSIPGAKAEMRIQIERIDTLSGQREVLLAADDADFYPGPISPAGDRAVVVRESRSTPEQAVSYTLWLLDLNSGERSSLAPDWDRWGNPVGWLPDGRTLVLTADHNGRSPIFLIDVESGAVRQLTGDDAAYTNVLVAPDGQALFALRSSYAFPAEAVRVELASGEITALIGPVERPKLPGRLEEVSTTAADGSTVRAWLVLPKENAGASPAYPLLLWIHGGPLGSWNAWTWRWNPMIMAARGYAVLLPDPALSTGYGQQFVQRGWGRWGAEPFTDLMAITDAVVARPDIDESRTAAMGGSFGGYMANWVAGHTDRFKAVVTHASLWELPGFSRSTDMAMYWRREMSEQMAAENSPHASVSKIVTPMLVIHGDKDYRVPIGEGLRLWYELLASSGLAADERGESPHRFLYFPDENHWILKPQHSLVWYSVVESFLAEHVLGQELKPVKELGLA
ncbi:dipeptidyl aminopeptidase/acylaminoacyl peptidase [Psychromicrobium silvestre]|uniref:Dipeptidyl aminopeptidase/acylaminoacyl peptidase n=1 Tax=Psychromicrobium silvestre TaxID=1645614 RepID=A0A7Y9LV05_9MICC|nr:S9 family peptidase [Psychromicrobium silvestre]NYE96074.1 dipeptidyl aminopeptidase/acylaminoacyl peptidase [Psychromicrobium silvestre]